MASVCGNHPVGETQMCKTIVFCPKCEGTPVSRKYFQKFLDQVEKTVFEVDDDGETSFVSVDLCGGEGDILSTLIDEIKEQLIATP